MMKSIVFGLALGLSTQAFAKPAVITSFSPQNLSETTNQIRAVFSEKMVSLSVNPNADIFNILCSPALAGRAGWDSDHSWTFDFRTKLHGNKLPGGSTCTVTLKTGIKDLAGEGGNG